MQRKKVLFITCEFYWGGAQKSFLKVVNEVAQQHECFIAVFDAGDQKAYGDIPIFSLDSGAKVTKTKAGRLLSRVSSLRRLKKKLHITHSISFMDGADILNILSRSRQEKVITSIRASIQFNDGYGDSITSSLRRKYLFPVLYKRADNVVAVSKAIKTELVSNYQLKDERVVSIYNFYDPAEYVEKKNEPVDERLTELFRHKKTIVAVGRLDKQKNFINLVQLFAIARQQNPELVLLVIGTGDDLPLMLAECRKNNLHVHSYTDGEVKDYLPFDVILLGYEANPHKFVARSTIFVLPSKWEGFPNALAEAMLVGATCIAADCPTGPSEMIHDKEDGFLLPVPVTQQHFVIWAKTISDICQGKIDTIEFGERAMKKMKVFSKDRIVPQWLNLLQ